MREVNLKLLRTAGAGSEEGTRQALDEGADVKGRVAGVSRP
jgi:hypothetical protein